MAINKQKTLKVVNPIAGVLFIIQAGTGIFHNVIPYEIFSKVHGLSGYVFAAAVAMHIILNWSWFKTAFGKRKKQNVKN
jgi:hypothetical protein